LDGSQIPNETTQAERQRLSVLVKYQPGGDHAIHIQLMTRILAVLRWWYRQNGDRRRDPMATVERFAESLSRSGAALTFAPEDKPPSRSKVKAHDAAQMLARRRWSKRKAKAKRKRGKR
jgi:hypothetical protein